jgi:hypothetical protein
MRRAALAAALFLVSPACGQGSAAPPEPTPLSPEVRAVIERTYDPSVDYSVVQTVQLTVGATTSTVTSAEFERGSMHRVETVTARAIANCRTQDLITYLPALDRMERTPGNDHGACGIGNPEPVLSSRMLPPVTGPWGRADVIELTGRKFVRRYVVTTDGLIVAGDWTPRRPDVGFAIRTLRVAVTRGAPDPAMFEEDSLRRTYAQPLGANAPPAP